MPGLTVCLRKQPTRKCNHGCTSAPVPFLGILGVPPQGRRRWDGREGGSSRAQLWVYIEHLFCAAWPRRPACPRLPAPEDPHLQMAGPVSRCAERAIPAVLGQVGSYVPILVLDDPALRLLVTFDIAPLARDLPPGITILRDGSFRDCHKIAGLQLT